MSRRRESLDLRSDQERSQSNGQANTQSVGSRTDQNAYEQGPEQARAAALDNGFSPAVADRIYESVEQGVPAGVESQDDIQHSAMETAEEWINEVNADNRIEAVQNVLETRLPDEVERHEEELRNHAQRMGQVEDEDSHLEGTMKRLDRMGDGTMIHEQLTSDLSAERELSDCREELTRSIKERRDTVARQYDELDQRLERYRLGYYKLSIIEPYLRQQYQVAYDEWHRSAEASNRRIEAWENEHGANYPEGQPGAQRGGQPPQGVPPGRGQPQQGPPVQGARAATRGSHTEQSHGQRNQQPPQNRQQGHDQPQYRDQ